MPRALRDRLAVELPEALRVVAEQTAADEMTSKWLWECVDDGAQVETVLMRYPDRATVCVSSQAGCAMGCTFCATGQEGFERHLTADEIVEQVLRAQHASPQRVGNVVFMGMGEPLANYEPVRDAIVRLHDDVGISARRITVSTVGVVPGIRRLADEDLPVTLAVSLHAPSDEEREAARAAEPSVSDRRGARRGGDVRRREGPARHLRVRVHPGRQRLASAGRGPRAARSPASRARAART